MKSLKGYICGTDPIDISCGATDVVIFPSVEILKDKRACWEQCGIIEVEITSKIIIPSKEKWSWAYENITGTTTT